MRTIIALLVASLAPSLPGQEAAPSAAEPAVPEPPAELVGFAAPRNDEADQRAMKLADRAIAEGRWDEAAAVLSDALGPPAKDGPRGLEEERLVTGDAILYASIAEAVRGRVEKLPEAGLAAWRARRGEGTPANQGARASNEPPVVPGAVRGAGGWSCVLGRPDHAAIDVAPDAEARPGSYARWIHRLTNYRQLESSQPARNVFYTVYPMQIVAHENLLFARSHQDVVAFDRATGAVRWRVDSDVPAAEQTHQSSSGFDSMRFFTDLGGWSLTVVPGEPDRLVVLSKSGRGTVRNGALEFAKNRLVALDARSGTVDWKRGEAEDPDQTLRGLTFTAPPAIASDARGEVLVVPAVSGDGFHAIGLDAKGKLLWARKVYSYIPAKAELVDETMAHGASLAAGGPIVAGAPGHGLVFALSARGETLWLRRYPVISAGYPAAPRWAPGHPIISAGKVIAAPFDGESLLVLDARTGALVWEKRPPTGYHALIGADRERVYAIALDGSLTASSLADGAAAWTSEAFGRPTGRGFVTSNRVYVAAERFVIALDPAKGTVLARFKLWDDNLPAPSPGNLFLAGGDLIVMAAWGLASIEPHEATWKTLETLGTREQLLRRSRLLRVEEKYGESLVDLRKALSSTSDQAEADKLRAELLDVSQDAARTTKDPEFLRRVLEEPDLIPSAAHRTAFVLKSAELLREEAPEAAAKMYREMIAAESGGDLVLTPEGLLADPSSYSCDALRELVAAGRVEPASEEEEKVSGWIDAAAEAENALERLSRIASRQPHVHASAAAGALLARKAEEEGDLTAAVFQLERLVADHPRLASEPELRAYLADLRGRARPGPAALELDLETAWTLRFESPTDLAGMAEGSPALPAIPVLEGSALLLLDAAGKPAAKLEIPGLPHLAQAHSKVATVLVEPALASVSRGRILLFTGAGLLEVLGFGEAGAEPRLRPWHNLEHPLQKYMAQPPASSAPVPRTKSSAKAAAAPAINDNQNLYARAEFDAGGNVSIVEPDGTAVVFEGRTGRLIYKSPGQGGLSAGQARCVGKLLAVEMAKPPGVAIHDLGRRTRTVVQAPATPWRAHLVPGVAALVMDAASGIQIRDLSAAAASPGDNDSAPPPTLWRDASPRGAPSVAFADASQVIAVESGGKLVSRSLRSGRLRWSIPFPEGFLPVRAYEVDGPEGLAGDIIIAASRNVDPEDGRGVLGDRVPQDLHFARVSRDGVKRWDILAAKGGVAFDGARLPVRGTGGETWLLAFNDRATTWRTRVVLLDIEKGKPRDLFALDLVEKPNHPPPALCAAFGGIAVETSGRLAFFAPGPAPAEKPANQPPANPAAPEPGTGEAPAAPPTPGPK